MSDRRVPFFFENRRLEGVAGESIAKALFRAGIRTLSYSVKYKRPRGLHCARGRCIMCHMEVDGMPGVPTCVTPLRDGMRIRRENFRPFFAPFLVFAIRLISFPAGFYYRMFSRPTVVREFFLGSLRRMAGVGRVTPGSSPMPVTESGPARMSPKSNYDVTVVGSGLSGMAAALAAAQNGASILLVDEYSLPGGHTMGHQRDGELATQRDTLARQIAEHTAIDYCPQTTASAFYPPNTLLLSRNDAARAHDKNIAMTTIGLRRGLKRVQARTFIFATGSNDIVPTFENNDLPGIFGSRAIRLLLERDALKPGERAVVYGTGDLVADATALLAEHDIKVSEAISIDSDKDAVRVKKAIGGEWITGVAASDRDGRKRAIPCDLLCTAFEGQGAYELAYQAGFRFALTSAALENKIMAPTKNEHEADGVSFFLVGELAGHRGSWRDRIASGEHAGNKATQTLSEL